MVISIIALLIAILLPALQKAREQARVAICSSNLRQIHLVYSLYADDNDDGYPYGDQIESSVGVVAFIGFFRDDLRLLLDPYQSSPAMFYCPSGAARAPTLSGELTRGPNDHLGWNSSDNYLQISYNIWPSDGWLFGTRSSRAVWQSPWRFVNNRNDLTLPTQEILAQDFAWTDNGFPEPGFINHPDASNEHLGITFKGSGFHNAYHDGHVAWRNVDEAALMVTFDVNMAWWR